MGIKNLLKLIKERAPGAISRATLEDLRGQRIAIDASICVYQWVNAGGAAGGIHNAAGVPINHIQGALYRTAKLVEAGITPVYVFDGPPPERKGATLAARRARGGPTPGRDVYAQVVDLLGAMGVPVLQAPGEAEAECAHLCALGSVDIVATPDMDALAFGARRVLVDLDAAKKSYTIVDYQQVLEGFSLTRAQFVDLCILLGCDYSATLPQLGYKGALPAIKAHGNIEGILASSSALVPAEFDYLGAREEFMAPLVYTVQREQLTLRVLSVADMDALRGTLVATYGLVPGRIDGTLRKLAKFYGLIYKPH